jgi:hypothetical protein
MKEKELRESAICAICNKPFGHTGLPFFWRVTIERYGVDVRKVQQQDGLMAAMLGGSALASIMGTDADLANPVGDAVKITVCETCAIDKPVTIGFLGLKE